MTFPQDFAPKGAENTGGSKMVIYSKSNLEKQKHDEKIVTPLAANTAEIMKNLTIE